MSPWPPRRHSPRFWAYVGGLAVLDVVLFALGAHSWSDYHAKPGGPTVMPVGTLLEFFVGVVILLGLLLVTLVRTRGNRRSYR